MADDKKEPWLNYLALTTIIFAVCATLSTFKGGGFSTRSVLSQEQASNAWSYFQSKSLKSYLYEVQKDVLSLELMRISKTDEETISAYNKMIDQFSKKIEKYDEEKKVIMVEAKQKESLRDDAQKHSRTFGEAVIFLQISILLSSIAALTKKKYIWVLGIVVGSVGLFFFLDGFFLFLS